MSASTTEESDTAEEHKLEHELYNADPECEHDIQAQWSGVKCSKCGGWFCL